MNLGIVGYRSYNNRAQFDTIMSQIIHDIGLPNSIITGDCKGTDELAREYGKLHNISTKIYYADWNKYGNSAGPKRNTEIINDSDFLVAFVSPYSKGTLDSIRKAETKGIRIIRIDI